MRILTQIYIVVTTVFCMPSHASVTAVFEFDISVCTPTCESFSSLDVGTQISGELSFSIQPGENWDATDLQSFDSTWFNPAVPAVGFTGDNITTANPLPIGLDRFTIGSGPIGPDMLTTGGTSNSAGLIDSGTLLFELDSSPFNSIGAWLIMHITSIDEATIELCLFYETTGCIDGATRAFAGHGCFNTTPEGCRQTPVPLPPAFWLFGFSLLSLATASMSRVAPAHRCCQAP